MVLCLFVVELGGCLQIIDYHCSLSVLCVFFEDPWLRYDEYKRRQYAFILLIIIKADYVENKHFIQVLTCYFNQKRAHSSRTYCRKIKPKVQNVKIDKRTINNTVAGHIISDSSQKDNIIQISKYNTNIPEKIWYILL